MLNPSGSSELDEVLSLLSMLENCCESVHRSLALNKENNELNESSLKGMQQTLAICQAKLKKISAVSNFSNAELSTKGTSNDRLLKSKVLIGNKKNISNGVPTFFEEEAEYEERERLSKQGSQAGNHGVKKTLSSRIRILPEAHASSEEKVGRLRVISA